MKGIEHTVTTFNKKGKESRLRFVDRWHTRGPLSYGFYFENRARPTGRIYVNGEEWTRNGANERSKKQLRLLHRGDNPSHRWIGTWSVPSTWTKHRRREKKYQFQLRRESIISVTGILAHFGVRANSRRAITSISVTMEKCRCAPEVIDPWLLSGRRSRTLYRVIRIDTRRFTIL